MTTKYKIIGQSIVFGAVLVLSLGFLFARPAPAIAACTPGDGSCTTAADCTAAGGTPTFKKNPVDNGQDYDKCNAKSTDGGSTGTGEEEPVTDSTDPAASGGKCAEVKNCDLVTQYVNPFVNLLAALVGIAVTISIIIGGIQYGSSAGDPQAVTAAKNRIRNAIIALITFTFLYALLNFLIPGGLL